MKAVMQKQLLKSGALLKIKAEKDFNGHTETCSVYGETYSMQNTHSGPLEVDILMHCEALPQSSSTLNTR